VITRREKKQYLHRLVGRRFVSTWVRWIISLQFIARSGCGLLRSLRRRMARLREYRLQMRRHEKMVRAVRQYRTQTDQDGHRTTSVRMVYVEADGPASTPRLPGRCQTTRVFSHSSTRPSDLHGMQPVSDPAVNRLRVCDIMR